MNADREEAAIDYEVRRHVYDHVMREGLPPTVAQTASALSTTPDNVGASFQRLADARVLVLQKGTGEILMSNPFSAVPTPFLVRAGGGSWWNLPRGEVLSLDRCWRLAKAWYGPDRREPEWRRRTVDEAEALFTELGLTSPFWRLS